MSEFLSPGRAYDWVGALGERRATLTPDRTALVDRTTGERYTYADLDARANRTARLLADHDVGEGDRVAVLSRNRPELVDLYFAGGKTGAVLAPLSHRLAAGELVAMLNDVDPGLLVVEEPFDDLAADVLAHDDRSFEAAVRSLSTGGEHAWAPWHEGLPADGSPVATVDRSMDDPRMLLHTGGSTGVPKEVVVTDGGILWNSVNTITAWGLRDDDVTPLTFPMFHTGGWHVITVPLFHMGGTVVLAREFDAGDVLQTVESEDASVLVAVPAMYRMMRDHGDWADVDLSTLRVAKSGGGPAREAVMEAWWDRGVDLSQGYGLTECGPNNFAMPDDWPHEKADTVGIPATHVDVRVVDDDGRELPAGEVGELEIAGPHAGDRYWRNPGETAETFGADGQGAGDGGRGAGEAPTADGEWVSTGDLASVDEAGYVSIEGRKKNMFVSGGENVYPPAVEDAVAAHPAVEDVVVVPVEDEQWGQVGKAVYEGDPDLALEELRSFLDDRLARFKHPRHLAHVDALPMSGPSKIDRTAVEAEQGDG
jgi:fatty-acyl-CoA synthase